MISNDSSRWSKYLREKFDINKYFDVISVSGDLKIKNTETQIKKPFDIKLSLGII